MEMPFASQTASSIHSQRRWMSSVSVALSCASSGNWVYNSIRLQVDRMTLLASRPSAWHRFRNAACSSLEKANRSRISKGAFV